MKLNIFSIPKDQVQALKDKLTLVKMKATNTTTINSWFATFYFSESPDPVSIPWVQTFCNFFSEIEEPKNMIYYAAYIWEKDDSCLVLSFGKSHFYLRQFCDQNFGLEIAKRIANEKDVRQKAAKRFAGRKRKEIRSYNKNTSLDIESGESVDYIQASIVDKEKWGKSGKFGASVLLHPEIELDDIPQFLSDILAVFQSPQLFDLPRTEVVRDEEKILKYDNELISAIAKNQGDNSDFSDSGHDLVGVDFIFPTDQTYHFYFKHNNSKDFDSLDMEALRDFIKDHNINNAEIFDIRIKILKEDTNPYSVALKESIEYKIDGENVILSKGKWTRFNEDYMTQLHTYIDGKIELSIGGLDSKFTTIQLEKGKGEPWFLEQVVSSGKGFEKGDKDFNNITIPNHTVEAWDLRKDKIVFAVKFGTPQKVGYVCDQATNTLEIMRNKPEYIKKLNFEKYCLWIGLSNKNIPKKLSQINSIIYKQKIESWARKCNELGIKPSVWLSQVVRKV